MSGSQPPKRGAFIVIEGLDRSGKSTQAARLHERLQSAGVDTKLIKFPDRTTAIGKTIDAYLAAQTELDDRAIHLLFSANRWELAPAIEAALAAGTTVLCDRYAFSGVAFTASKPHAPSFAWCRAPDAGLPAPDLTLLLDVSPAAAAARGGFGAERYERAELQARVRDAFARIGDEMGEGEAWIALDADQPEDVVAQEVWAEVEPLARGTTAPLKRLWDEQEDKRRNFEMYT